MMSFKQIAIAIVTVATTAGAASAGTVFFDFSRFAQEVKSAAGQEAHWNNGELAAFDGVTFTDGTVRVLSGTTYLESGGVLLQVSATGDAPRTDAYLDGLSGGPGGIGACVSLLPDCGSKDNISALVNEVVTIEFFDTSLNAIDVEVLASYHTNADHQVNFVPNTEDLAIETFDGLGFSGPLLDLDARAISDAIFGGDTRVVGIERTTSAIRFNPVNNSQVYVSGLSIMMPVPEPSALALIAIGLLGFGAARRFRR
jgi:hypothetical protein